MALTIEDLQTRLLQYEQNGAAKLYYSLNRKANEMADLLNRHNLANMVLDDPKDKTFDRLKVIWNDATSLATAVKTLADVIGASGDEEKDTKAPTFRITPESMADNIGGSAGQNK